MKRFLGWLALLGVSLAVFYPTLASGFIWDDDAHVTRLDLQTWHGLARIWTELGATQQYYPLLHSAFWFEHRLWGDVAWPYHLLNIVLHATAAWLIIRALQRLQVPGAWFAGLLFAVHPVAVETVAWVSEQKNTLSTVFYLLSALAYLDFDEKRRGYLPALGWFLLALGTKTVTASLPAALLVVFWWKRGRLDWKRDVVPLLPWFVIGAIGGLLTAWVEHSLIGARGAPFALGPMQRGLLAARVIAFYAAKVCWPLHLIFIYRHWTIEALSAPAYGYVLLVFAWLAAAWALRARSRAPLAGSLYFIGTLFPVLGFVNVYPFLFSYVADHFQYLARLGLIVLIAAGTESLIRRASHAWRRAGRIAEAALVGGLALLAHADTAPYRDVATLYRTTIARNPDCWIFRNNLGVLLAGEGKFDEAIDQYRQSVALFSTYPLAENNWGNALLKERRFSEAMAHYRKAIAIKPDFPDAYMNLGSVYMSIGEPEEATNYYEEALRLRPAWVLGENNLAAVLASLGRPEEAIRHCLAALRILQDAPVRGAESSRAIAHNNWATALIGERRYGEAIDQCHQALGQVPDYAEAHNNLGQALTQLGKPAEALPEFQTALRLKPDFGAAYRNLGIALVTLGRPAAAVPDLEAALTHGADDADLRNDLGVALARGGRPQEALAQLEQAVRFSPQRADLHRNLAIVLNGLGRKAEAQAQLELSNRLQTRSP